MGLSAAELLNEGKTFTVIRNPVHRFYSLYRNIFCVSGDASLVLLRHLLCEECGFDTSAASAEEHAVNCDVLLRWIETDLDGQQTVNPIWRPQDAWSRIMLEFNSRLLLFDELEKQLPFLIDREDFERCFYEEFSPLAGQSNFCPRDAVLSLELKARIRDLYPWDTHLFYTTIKLWKNVKIGEHRSERAPRFEDYIYF